MSGFDVTAVRREFPITENCVYVNHAAVGPISRRVQQAMQEQSELHLTQIDTSREMSLARYEEGRRLAAQLVGSRPEQVAYIQNTSHGISLIANGLTWQAGDNVVLPELEFPSNYLAWLGLQAQGVELRFMKTENGRLLPDQLHQLIDQRTKVVTLSHVQFFNGFQCDLAAFGDICQQHGALLVVDGTQSVGALRVDVGAMGIDALVVSAHKWMLGPLGIGFMALSPRALQRLKVAVVGWLSVERPFEFRRQLDLLPDARRFEPGTENGAGMFGLTARLAQIQETGAQVIERRILALTDQFGEGLHQQGYTITSPRGLNERSGIVTFTHPHLATEQLFTQLNQANVRASVRNGAIRISPHYYNSEDEMDFIVNSLP
ncbi:MAG: aminotransferase class V-fold PLP-dependent enzyme [Ardenticatenaceae bacterium]|nr:aminotransferase class V-fold PLP-dependent enzyme [Ardenticatenaceae bacterium]